MFLNKKANGIQKKIVAYFNNFIYANGNVDFMRFPVNSTII